MLDAFGGQGIQASSFSPDIPPPPVLIPVPGVGDGGCLAGGGSDLDLARWSPAMLGLRRGWIWRGGRDVVLSSSLAARSRFSAGGGGRFGLLAK
ncbi:hypothetical protein Dimus_018372 [Dionaea muscipula]